MLKMKCVDKHRDEQGRICGYLMIRDDGKLQPWSPYALKQAILEKSVEVRNLTLTSDGRLVDKSEEKNTKQVYTNESMTCTPNPEDKARFNEILYLINKNYTGDSSYKHASYWNQNDIDKLRGILVHMGLNVHPVDIKLVNGYNYKLSCGEYLIACDEDGVAIKYNTDTLSENIYHYGNREEDVTKLISKLREQTSKNVKDLGTTLEAVINAYKSLIKQAKMKNCDVSVYCEHRCNYKITLVDKNTSRRISQTYLQKSAEYGYSIKYTDETGNMKESRAGRGFPDVSDNEEFRSCIFKAFERTIRDARNNSFINRITGFRF